jgi:hypothetical protein
MPVNSVSSQVQLGLRVGIRIVRTCVTTDTAASHNGTLRHQTYLRYIMRSVC